MKKEDLRGIIVIVGILAITITMAVCIINIGNKNNAVTTTTTVTKNEAKIIELSNAEKVAYNIDLNKNHKVQILEGIKTVNGKFTDGEFTDEQKLNYTALWASENDSEAYSKKSKYIENSSPYTIEVDAEYLVDLSRKIFAKGIDITEISSRIVDGKITSQFVGGLGINIAKFNKLVLNEKTEIYTLYYDIVSPVTDDRNNTRLGQLYEANTTDYKKDEITKSLTIEFKKYGNLELIKSMNLIYDSEK